MSGPRFHRGFTTPNMTGETRSQEEKSLQQQRLKFQETQVEASEKALTRASKADNESSTSANADIANPRKIKTAEKDAENVYKKASSMEDDLSRLQALTPADRWNTEEMDALFSTVRERTQRFKTIFRLFGPNTWKLSKNRKDVMPTAILDPSTGLS